MGETQTIGGHKVESTGRTNRGLPGSPRVWRCTGCGAEGDYHVFSVGIHGCAGDPGSVELWVCPGGERCDGHPDTDAPEWRRYKESNTMSLDMVPKTHHTAESLGMRAQRAYIGWADRVGVKFSVWAPVPERNQPGAGGGKVAEMSFGRDPRDTAWSAWVDASGKITARRGNK